jgi:hypothetical protein
VWNQDERKGTMYSLATLGARTERGGYVTRATLGQVICGLRVARVSDVVTYRDGSQAAIIDGSGLLFADHGKCGALVGSTLDNGDTITDSPERDGGAHRDTYEPVTEEQVIRGREKV